MPKFLSGTRKVRNKLIHSEFDALMEEVEALHNEPLDRERLVKVSLDGDNSEVSHIDPKNSSGIFELLLLYASSGGFQTTYDTFQKTIDIIKKCTKEMDNKK